MGDEAVPKCEVGLHGGDVQDEEGGLRVQGLQRLQPDQDGAGDDERKGMEEQAREQDVHETVQVHFWREQGTRGGGDDCPRPLQDEDAGRWDGEQADVLLPQQEAPGQPTNPHRPVKIEQNKEFTVYVHRFGGYAMSDSVNLREARRFAEVLSNAGEEVDTGTFYTAGYDSPMKFWNRRNEVMFLVPGNDL